MSKIEETIYSLRSLEFAEEKSESNEAVGMTLATLIYLGVMLSVPLVNIWGLLRLLLIPLIMSPMCGIRFETIFTKSLFVLPLLVGIGIFNPLLDREPMTLASSIIVSRGWVTFVSILIRGLLSVQVLLILMRSYGFRGFCHSLSKLGMPSFFVNQLLMVFRYLRVLLEEALTMKRARMSRGYGRKNLTLEMWGNLTGSLFMRSLQRASQIHNAMISRGYDGKIPLDLFDKRKWSVRDILKPLVMISITLIIRFI